LAVLHAAMYQSGRPRLCPGTWRAGLAGELKGKHDEGLAAIAAARVTAILIKSNVAAGWGYNAQGQLGDGTITSRSGAASHCDNRIDFTAMLTGPIKAAPVPHPD
jgi:hypothetical protein